MGTVKYNQISPKNFRCGDIVKGSDGNQYVIDDADKGIATLILLPDDECIKPEFLSGSVDLRA